MPHGPLKAVRPGFGSRGMETLTALELLRDQLLYKALYEAFAVETVEIRVGTVIPKMGKNGTKILMRKCQARAGKIARSIDLRGCAVFRHWML